jgi:broad specificity phosphatase PhoE
MKLILVRHEERGIDVGFFSELTDKGILNSLELPEKIKLIMKEKTATKFESGSKTDNNYTIDAIFCSPFIRTLQTVYKCSKEFKKKVKLEYGLYEYLHNPYFLLFDWYYGKKDIKDKDLLKIIDNKYKSVVKKDDLKVLEDETNLEKRIIEFFDSIKEKYKNKTVLVVTHEGVINKIKDIYVKKTDMSDKYPMGHIEVYDIL